MHRPRARAHSSDKTIVAIPTSSEKRAFLGGFRLHSSQTRDLFSLVQTGMGPDCLSDLLAGCMHGAAALVSVGTAGALAPDLCPGDMLLPKSIVSTAGSTPVTSEWREHLQTVLASAGVPACDRPLLQARELIHTVAAKRRLYADTGCVAVDMESGLLAKQAALAGIPYIVARVVVDPADRTVPRSAGAVTGPDGNLKPGALLLALAKNPGDAAGFLRLARDFRQAAATLRALGIFGTVALLPGADRDALAVLNRQRETS